MSAAPSGDRSIRRDDRERVQVGSQTLCALAGEGDIGGMMTKPAQMPTPHWNFYIWVDSVAAAAGGRVVNGPVEVPTGQWVLQAIDPQGAFFCLLSAEK